MGFTSLQMPLLGFLVACFFIQGLEAVSCPNNWFLFEQNCYGFFETNMTWNDAETECTSFGKKAHLASILSERELNSVSSSLLTGYEESFRVWIGMYKLRGGKARMRWIDASVVEYMPWAPRQPSDCKRKQNCVELYANNYKAWNDQFCDVKNPYLCKMAMY